MKPISPDLRERVIKARADGATQKAVAKRFGVSKSFVEKLSYRQRDTGSSAALPHGGGRKRSLREHEEVLRKQVEAQPDATLEELCASVAKATGLGVSVT